MAAMVAILDIKTEHFQDSHLGCWNRTILAILNLYVAPISPLKFQLGSFACCLKFFFYFNSGSHFVLPSKTILAILVKGSKEKCFCESFFFFFFFLKLGYWP